MLSFPFSPRLVSAIALTSVLSATSTFASVALAASGTLPDYSAQQHLVNLPAPVKSPLFSAIVSSSDLPENLPSDVTEAVLQDIVKSFGIKRDALSVVKAESQTWKDGCLGLAAADRMCTQVLVPGWQVTVKAKEQRWIYRTNDNGTVVKVAKQPLQMLSSALKSVRMSDRDLPPALKSGVMFRVIASGGFTGQTMQTLLMNDGRMIRSRVNPDGTLSSPKTYQINSQQLRQFQKLLTASQMEKFDRLSYPSVRGAADFLTFTMTSRSGTVQYAETIKNQLPDRLKIMIQAWNQMVRN